MIKTPGLVSCFSLILTAKYVYLLFINPNPLTKKEKEDAAADKVKEQERPAIRAYRRIVWGQTAPLVSGIVPFDPAPLEIIATPGHSEDHIAVWDAERGIVASGDLFLGVKVRVAHEHESPSALLRSLKTVVALKPRLLLDAHRGALLNATELLRAKIDWLEKTIGEILSLAAVGADEREIQRRVLGAEPFVGRVSFGEYSKRSLVHGVLQEQDALMSAASPNRL